MNPLLTLLYLDAQQAAVKQRARTGRTRRPLVRSERTARRW
jgi:hypothetical protein